MEVINHDLYTVKNNTQNYNYVKSALSMVTEIMCSGSTNEALYSTIS
jgi:hypothetical protein